jgi:molecular chaperone GrpE (heat shock protein)
MSDVLTYIFFRARKEIEILEQEKYNEEQSKTNASTLLQSRIESLQGELTNTKDRYAGLKRIIFTSYEEMWWLCFLII